MTTPPEIVKVLPKNTEILKEHKKPKEFWLTLLEKDPVLYNLAKCESGLNPLAVNPRDSNGLPSLGLMQYQTETWKMFTKAMDFQGDIMNPYDQLIVTQWAWANNLQNHWGCWKKIK